MPKGSLHGVIVPVLTPFDEDLCPDQDRFVENCRWLINGGANGLAVLGPTSEGNSICLRHKLGLLEALASFGLPTAKVMPAVGACAINDVLLIARKSLEMGCAGLLMQPPFYYRNVSDDGVLAYFSEIIERVGDPRFKVYLYHAPSHTAVPFHLDLIGRLISAYPQTIVGMKDSGGDWSFTESVLRTYPEFDVFPGSEAFLLQGLRAGTCGCISPTSSANVAEIRLLYDTWQAKEAEARQRHANEVRRTIQAFPIVPALKAIFAHFHKAPEWRKVAPPLCALSPKETATLLSRLKSLNPPASSLAPQVA